MVRVDSATPVSRLRHCLRQGGAQLVVKPKPAYEGRSWREMLAKVRGRPASLQGAAARSALCRRLPPAPLCARADCTEPDLSFLWMGDPNGMYFAALLVKPSPSGVLRAYQAAEIYNMNEDICRSSDTGQLMCATKGVEVLRPTPTSVTVQADYFASAGRFCNDAGSDQAWLFDSEGVALALLLMPRGWLSRGRVALDDARVAVSVEPDCSATATPADFAELPADGGASTSWNP
jgi:hypothetical protein